jgi:hypothetical protein
VLAADDNVFFSGRRAPNVAERDGNILKLWEPSSKGEILDL